MNRSTLLGGLRLKYSTLAALGLGLGLAQPVAFAQALSPPVTPAAPAPAYRVAFNGSVSVGTAGWGSELSGISEVAGRVQLRPWLGIGLSYLRLSASNNECYAPFELDAFEAFATWRPVVGKWFDPFVQAGALGVIDPGGGGYMGTETTSRFGLEGMAGFDFVLLPFALGVHVRSGVTNRTWTVAGLHLEGETLSTSENDEPCAPGSDSGRRLTILRGGAAIDAMLIAPSDDRCFFRLRTNRAASRFPARA